MFPKPIEKWSKTSALAYRIGLPIFIVLWLIPLFAVFMVSIRPISDIFMGNVMGWPSQFHFAENYSFIIKQTNLPYYFLNTIRITVPTAILAVTISAMAGYALSAYQFKGATLIYLIFVAGNFVPLQILLIPISTIAVKTGLYNTATGLVLFHAAFQIGFCTFFIRNFIRDLPQELIENARIEGVKEYQIFIYIIIPLIKPAIAANLILVFTFVWNDYFWATVLTNGDSVKPITAGIETLNGQFITRYNLTSAASLLATLPPIVLFFMMQKHFVTGLTFGASRG